MKQAKFSKLFRFSCNLYQMISQLLKVCQRVLKKAFSSEFDAGDDGTIKIGGPKFLSESKWPKFVIKI